MIVRMMAKSSPQPSPSFILRPKATSPHPQPLVGPQLRLVVVEDADGEESQRRGDQQEAAQQDRPQSEEELQLGRLRALAKHGHRAQEVVDDEEVDGGFDSA